jgi:8-oxo-dGTP pyrophosphatase MutT (NUDIX family)
MADADPQGELPIQQLGGQRYRVHLPRLNYRSAFAPKRRAEVAMLIQRLPGWVLLQTKEHYPPGAFRLPTGTLGAGESSEAGMLRELAEEANLRPGRHRVLFRLEYIVSGGRDDFFTEAHVIEAPTGELKVNDPVEKISAWREARVDELAQVAADLRRLEGPWAGWGLFRSAVHQLAGQLLGEG